MDFYTDGSKITKPYPAIGWGAVCDSGVVIANGCFGGTNINAEIFARVLCHYTTSILATLLH